MCWPWSAKDASSLQTAATAASRSAVRVASPRHLAPFGRPSGIFIDKNDMLRVSDSESEGAPGKDPSLILPPRIPRLQPGCFCGAEAEGEGESLALLR